ncbi:MAG: dihydrofolate reductase family protein [Thermoguttaceae bacterium]
MKISMYVAISLDGFIAKLDGSIDWLTDDVSQTDIENDDNYREFFASVDAIVMGGKTFRQVLTFGNWQYRGKKCVVVSRTETKTDVPDLVFTVDTPEQIVERLQRENCQHVWVMGGGEIHSLFLRAELIDEMRIFVMPKILGEGVPLFAPPVPEMKWKLLAMKCWRDQIVELRYEKRQTANFSHP